VYGHCKASVVGFGFTAYGILVIVHVVPRFFMEGRTAPGFPFLASLIPEKPTDAVLSQSIVRPETAKYFG
jgi:hypothetical protein